MKYVFARSINGTDETGIINVDDMTILCLCVEEKSKVIIEALKISSNAVLEVSLPSELLENFKRCCLQHHEESAEKCFKLAKLSYELRDFPMSKKSEGNDR